MENAEKIKMLMDAIEEGDKLIDTLEEHINALCAELTELRKTICGKEHCSVNCDSVDHCHMQDHCTAECTGQYCGISKENII